MVGDRVDTDIAGGINLGVDTLLVMTGVTGLAELAELAEPSRPSYVAADLSGLLEPHPAPREAEGSWTCGGWTAETDQGSLRIDGDGTASDWWRVAAAASWAYLDQQGEVVDVSGLPDASHADD